MLYLYLAAGAVAGMLARYQIGLWAAAHWQGGFPWGTFLINVAGSFLLGFLMHSLIGGSISRDLRLMLTTGFCGAFTTFSTFSFETVTLFNEGHAPIAFAYAGGSVVCAPAACWLGYLLAGAVSR